ncbi:MAG: hypothetical protein M1838_000794 [Thelocarpon superellum]|nr:MAG: hypothetical protein M1838_000794 [Thelocarpon superellum]
MGTLAVAAVGFALGRPPRSVSTSAPVHKKQPTLPKPADRQDDFTSHSSPAGPVSSSSPPSYESLRPRRDSLAHAEPNPLGQIRRKSSVGWDGLKRLSDLRLEQGAGADHDLPGSDSKLRRAWIHRLSRASASKTPSPTSSPGLDATSVAFSNDSGAAMLRGGPAADPSHPLAPNKLVKRSSSHHTSLRITSAPPAAKGPILRRPATSHQRSATIQQRQSHLDELDHARARLGSSSSYSSSPPDTAESRPFPPKHSARNWRRYFVARRSKFTKEAPRSKESRSKRPGGANVRPTHASIKRIQPDPHCPPTLLMPTAIAPASDDDDAGSVVSATVARAGESFFLDSSPPSTPPGLDTFFASSQSEEVPGQQAFSEVTPSPQRSFSISDLLSGHPTWLVRPRRSLSKRQSRISLTTGKRYSSAPPTSLPDRSMGSMAGMRGSPRTDITDPGIFAQESPSHRPSHPPIQWSSPPPPSVPRAPESDPRPRVSSVAATAPHLTPVRRSTVSSAGTALPGPPSSPPSLPAARLHRFSAAAPSERASTLVDSDNELRASALLSEDDLDFQSETVFDSLRTGATGSSTGARGPGIEHIFDESPPHKLAKARSRVAQVMAPTAHVRDVFAEPSHDIPEESESTSTPRREGHHGPSEDPMPSRRGSEDPAPKDQPTSSRPLNTDTLDYDLLGTESHHPRWSLDGDDDEEDWDQMDELMGPNHTLSTPKIQSQRTPSRSPSRRTDHLAARDGGARPKIVQAKSANPPRGSRPNVRPRLNAVHARSQSVPVVPDPDTQHERGAGAARYGTWGLGSKVVSEDWNEDFDFEGTDDFPDGSQARGTDEGAAREGTMIVPEAIRARQANVIGHLGHVRDFALLVEDLKRLRTLAVAKKIVHGPSAELWKEAEGIIDLATLDDDSLDLPPPRSPASSGFGFDPFDGEPAPLQLDARGRRKSVLSLDDDIFGGAGVTPPTPHRPRDRPDPPPQSSPAASGRAAHKTDRDDSAAVAKSVVKTMHQRRTTSDPVLGAIDSNQQSKVFFDTTTLRDLVAHVTILTRRLTEIVRTADSVSSTPSQSPKLSPTPSLGQVLAESAASSPSLGKARHARAKNGHGVGPDAIKGKENELNGHMSMMTFI